MKTGSKPTGSTLEESHQHPDSWIWGIFYFNRRDRRIFPPKRHAYLGWTVNFANPVSVVAMAALIAGIMLLALLIK